MKRFFRKPEMSDPSKEPIDLKKYRLPVSLAILVVVLLAAHLFVLMRTPARQDVEVIPESRPATTPAAVRPAAPGLPAASAQEAEPVLDALRKTMADYRFKSSAIRRSGDAYTASIPGDFNYHRFHFTLQEKLNKGNARVVHTSEDRRRNRVDLTISIDDKKAIKLGLYRRESLSAVHGEAAIIIDDFGYAYNDLVQKFLFYPKPLTISIIPGLEQTAKVARDAKLANREVLVHMPMEPLNEKFSDEGYTLLSGMDGGTVRLRVQQAFAKMPHAIGMNNHQGSRVTAEAAVMRALLSELKRMNKIFIDSRTNPASVAVDVARQLKVPVGANQIFLDAENDEAFIERQMQRMAEMAEQQGRVIAIAHMRKKTFTVLERMMPQLEQQGIRFVSISALFN